ncbi:MAG TPA: hypothetical protein VD998_01415 [Verrucomicrobiae bacterium]|nr:hypothetical protein [Verrucomicrobiae bacterium]
MQKVKLIVISLGILLVLSLAGLTYTILKLSPDQNGTVNIAIFYTLIFLISFCSATLIGFLLRRRFGVREFLTQHLRISIRQGLWLAILITCSFLLQSLRLFSWTNSLLLAGALIFLESFFLANDKKII